MSKVIYPKDFWTLSKGIKLHFDSGSKYSGENFGYKIKSVSDAAFEKSNAFSRCVKISRKCKTIDTARRYITSNILQDNLSVHAYEDDCYIDWLARMESITYHVVNQCKAISHDFDELFTIKNTYPLIIEHFFENNCSYETLACINKLTDFTNKIDINDILIWPEVKYKIQQYTTLFIMDVNLSKIRHQLVDTYKY